MLEVYKSAVTKLLFKIWNVFGQNVGMDINGEHVVLFFLELGRNPMGPKVDI